jgi:uncharacterized SAM-binding protein YcdF (DUF218 family)
VAVLREFIFISSLVFLIWFCGFIYFAVDTYKYELNPPQSEAVVVLTGGQGRIYYGYELLKKGLAHKLFITGVGETNFEDLFRSAVIDLDELLKNNFDITLGHNATNTHENALEAKEWIEKNQIKSITLVTSSYHMPRSKLEFRKTIPDVKINTYAVRPNFGNLNNTKDYMRYMSLLFFEYNKYVYKSILYRNFEFEL